MSDDSDYDLEQLREVAARLKTLEDTHVLDSRPDDTRTVRKYKRELLAMRVKVEYAVQRLPDLIERMQTAQKALVAAQTDAAAARQALHDVDWNAPIPYDVRRADELLHKNLKKQRRA